jgi:hypothetical protein
VSLVLLAATLCLLRAGGRALVALPALTALWVNLDGWFVLGPLVVALHVLGERLGGERRVPLWVLPACLLACLCGPHHVRALTLPAELSPAVWLSPFRNDVRLAPLFASPWRLGPLLPSGGISLAAWAFLVLLALGVVSFAVNPRALRSWRGPVWLALALLAAWQARLVPFFAVVAGPIAALNLGERLSPQALAAPGRAVTAPAALVLVALTWPGWLQGFQRRDRPLAWGAHADPSLRRAAETLGRWQEQGALPEGARTFALHPDVAHYLAWFCPGQRSFLDSRLPLFVRVAADYERLCRSLNSELTTERASVPSSADWQQPLRDHNVVCVVFYDPDLRRLAPALRQLADPEGPWELLRVDGQAVLAGWKPSSAGRVAVPPFDPDRMAFAAEGDEALLPAPERGPDRLARHPAWWQPYLERLSGSTWEADAAAVYLRLFEDGASRQLRQQSVPVLARYAAGLAGDSALLGVASRLVLDGVFVPDLHQRPAALPLLAVRAARRAVAAHPEDGAWLVLAQAYLLLDRVTAEGMAHAGLAPLAEVRRVQAVTALVRAVTLRPDLAAAHEMLARLFAQRQYLDLALRHRTAELRLVRAAGALPEEDEAAFAARIERLEQAVEQMRAVVQTSENRFVVRTDTLSGDPLARARVALDLGLGGQALDVLLRSQADLYGVEGLRLLLELLLTTGRAEDARDLLDRDEMRRHPDGLGLIDLPGRAPDGRRFSFRLPAHDWFSLCRAAAAGDYDLASVALERLRDRLQREEGPLLVRLAPALAGRVALELATGAAAPALLLQAHNLLDRDLVSGWLAQGQFVPVERADLHVLEGMLLLERGVPEAASEQFRRALDLYGSAAPAVPALPGRPLAVVYLRRTNRE